MKTCPGLLWPSLPVKGYWGRQFRCPTPGEECVAASWVFLGCLVALRLMVKVRSGHHARHPQMGNSGVIWRARKDGLHS